MAGSPMLEPRGEDREITLSTGKLLGIFFGLVFICAIFFAMGYLLGHSAGAGQKTEIVETTSGGAAAGKPGASSRSEPPVSSPTPATPMQPQPATASANPSSPAYVPASAPDIKAVPGGTYSVQVAAVSKQEDAQSLVSALQKKQYPAFVNSVASDGLFHVQVGPFADPKDAESVRSRLASEGYDAMVRKQ